MEIQYIFQGQELGRLVGREFQTDFEEFDALDLVRRMSPEDRIHMKRNAYGVHKLLEHFGINPGDCVEDADLVIYVADKGYKRLSQLCRYDRQAWKLVKQRGLAKKLFPGLQPADCEGKEFCSYDFAEGGDAIGFNFYCGEF